MKILIAGAGYVGSACVRRMKELGHEVLCWVRSPESSARLREAGFDSLVADLASAEAWTNLNFKPDAVLYCPSTRGGGVEEYRSLHHDGLALAVWNLPPPTRFIYISSSSVYGQSDASWVDESSETNPPSESGKILVEAEKMVVQAGGAVLRLAGIYGPGRTVLLEKFLEGKAVMSADPKRFLNLIHLEDIVTAFEMLLSKAGVAGEIYNGVDDNPSTYSEIYNWLSEKFKKPAPTFAPLRAAGAGKKRGITNKRVSNAKLRALGWQPRYPSFREGYARLLKT
ncbi:MAG: SDR family oxidoreductase [Methylacidiphilales bacterium]|nr:SDR family oxidoreductase [Candidatus Methylacidiphilales bacterium]